MKILYRQNPASSGLNVLGVQGCYLKEIMHKNDYKKTTLKSHLHTGYEIHMVFSGKQCYEIDDALYEVNEKEFIIIAPKIKHRMISASENLIKYSITFNSPESMGSGCICSQVSEDIISSIYFIKEEFEKKLPLSGTVIGNRVFEVLALLFRSIGYKEKRKNAETDFSGNQLELAKKFISDNIERSLSVADVAAYCHLSTRQITRIFIDTENISPAKYIVSAKMNQIDKYLKNTDLSLRQISELFSYSNEYYFSAAFKKHFGLPPATYRKMFR